MIAAAIAAAAAFSCRPELGLGSVTLPRRGSPHVIDLATCRERVKPWLLYRGFSYGQPLSSPDGRFRASVRSSGHGKTARQTIWVAHRRTGRARPLFSETQYYKSIGPGETPGPIMLRGWSTDNRWIFFFVVPGGLGSIMADGLTLQVVSVDGGHRAKLEKMLPYRDYLAWCGGRLVLTAGGDRVATDHKRLLVAAPPRWRAQPLVAESKRTWGSLTCASTGRWLVAQSQGQSTSPSFFAARWALADRSRRLASATDVSASWFRGRVAAVLARGQRVALRVHAQGQRHALRTSRQARRRPSALPRQQDGLLRPPRLVAHRCLVTCALASRTCG